MRTRIRTRRTGSSQENDARESAEARVRLPQHTGSAGRHCGQTLETRLTNRRSALGAFREHVSENVGCDEYEEARPKGGRQR
jgi:hypothetical protein